MLRSELQTRCLNIIGDQSLTTKFTQWLDTVLTKLEAAGKWDFLNTEKTYQTVDATASVTLTDLSITDYRKGIFITSPNWPRRLVKVPIDTVREMGARTGDPCVFALWKNTVYFSPVPETGNTPLLTIGYYKAMTLPTADGDDIEDVTGIRSDWVPGYILDGTIGQGFLSEDDPRHTEMINKFEKEHLPLMLQEASEGYLDTQINEKRNP